MLTFIVLTFLLTTAGWGCLLYFALRRVVRHCQGNAEASRTLTEHVLVPLLGRHERKPDLPPPAAEPAAAQTRGEASTPQSTPEPPSDGRQKKKGLLV